MMKLWKIIKHLAKPGKKHHFLTGHRKERLEEISDRINAEIEAKKKQNRSMKIRLMKRVSKLESRAG